MAAAMEHPVLARASLDKAEHNKGGWRGLAIDATDRALHEANRGCDFVDTH